MSNMPLPDIAFEGGKMYNMTLDVHKPASLEDLEYSLDPSANALVLKGRQLFAQMQGDFVVRFFLMDIKGVAYVNVTDLAFDISVGLTTQQGQRPQSLAPALKLVDIGVNIDPNKISIKLEGGLVAKIATLFTEIFKKQILTQVVQNVKAQAKSIIEQDVNKDLQEYGTQEPIPELE